MVIFLKFDSWRSVLKTIGPLLEKLFFIQNEKLFSYKELQRGD